MTLYPGIKSLVDITQRFSQREVLEKSRGFAGLELIGEEGAALYAFLDALRAGRWARPELLVETSWLAARLDDPRVRIVDLRPTADYEAGHIPGAVGFPEGALRQGMPGGDYLPPAAAIAERLGQVGVNSESQVVVYDDAGGRSAARLWFVLTALGHGSVSLVNGGWSKWRAEERPTTRDVPRPAPAVFVPKQVPAAVCSGPELLARQPDVRVLDARSAGEFGGAAGRIPGAIHLEWKEAVTGPHSVFKSGPELLRLLAARGITPHQKLIPYCASGGRAAHLLFTLRLSGFDRSQLYYGSFEDYLQFPNAPVEK